MIPLKQTEISETDVAAPVKLQREMAHILEIVNGRIDHDNIPDGILTKERVKSGAILDHRYKALEAPVQVTGSSETPTSVWNDVEGLAINLNTQDSFLQIETSGWYDSGNPATIEYPMVFAIVVDGVRHIMGGPSSYGPQGCWWCTAEVPVGPGRHTVQVQFAHTDNPGVGILGSAWERNFNIGQLLVQECKR